MSRDDLVVQKPLYPFATSPFVAGVGECHLGASARQAHIFWDTMALTKIEVFTTGLN
jgi:hypothetical protein